MIDTEDSMEIVTKKGTLLETRLTWEELQMFFEMFNGGAMRLMLIARDEAGVSQSYFVSDIDQERTIEAYEQGLIVPGCAS